MEERESEKKVIWVGGKSKKFSLRKGKMKILEIIKIQGWLLRGVTAWLRLKKP